MSKVRSGLLRGAVIAGLALGASQVDAACTFAGSGEPSLQTTFDDVLGADSVDVQSTCLADGSEAGWSTVGQVGLIDITIELAGFANLNSFGIYDPILGTELRLFEGNDGAGVSGRVETRHLPSGQWQARVRDFNASPEDGSNSTRWSTWSNFSSPVFGFYLRTPNGTFYSETGKNGDGKDHMYAYGPLGGDYYGQYVMAWEDLFNGGDGDYQDFVATLQDITPVPLPTAIWLLASGLVGLAGVTRRRA